MGLLKWHRKSSKTATRLTADKDPQQLNKSLIQHFGSLKISELNNGNETEARNIAARTTLRTRPGKPWDSRATTNTNSGAATDATMTRTVQGSMLRGYPAVCSSIMEDFDPVDDQAGVVRGRRGNPASPGAETSAHSFGAAGHEAGTRRIICNTSAAAIEARERAMTANYLQQQTGDLQARPPSHSGPSSHSDDSR
jgi:hypothetical protein